MVVTLDDTIFFIGYILNKRNAPFLILSEIGIIWNIRVLQISFLCMLVLQKHREPKKLGKLILALIIIFKYFVTLQTNNSIAVFYYRYGTCEYANYLPRYANWSECLWEKLPPNGILQGDQFGLLASNFINDTHYGVSSPFWTIYSHNNKGDLLVEGMFIPTLPNETILYVKDG